MLSIKNFVKKRFREFINFVDQRDDPNPVCLEAMKAHKQRVPIPGADFIEKWRGGTRNVAKKYIQIYCQSPIIIHGLIQ